MPSNYGDLILNKEDFCYLRPILNKVKEEFQILTYEEITKLDDNQKDKYYNDMDEYYQFDETKMKIYDDMYYEDMKTSAIEDCEVYSSNEEFEDDY